MKVVRNFFDDHKRILLELRKPCWWKSFVNTRNTCQKSRSNNTYEVDIIRLSCTCFSWERNPFFLRKHVVAGRGCPLYRTVTLNRNPLFIVIDPSSSRCLEKTENQNSLCMCMMKLPTARESRMCFKFLQRSVKCSFAHGQSRILWCWAMTVNLKKERFIHALS